MTLTQAEFAQAVGVSCQVTVCRWERGKAVPHRMWQRRLMELEEKLDG